ncbi:MAG: hypothetical protein PHQ60_16250 [Sideroxydans sp.]|nr:hypothetical protein [Sideroxydans sp.]
MAGKRTTDQEDYNRFARNIYGIYGDEIQDIDSYDRAFDDYMGEDLQGGQDRELRKGGFEALKKMHPSIVQEYSADVKKIDKRKQRKVIKPKGEYVYIAYAGDKVVYARQDKVIYHYKKGMESRIVYRDRKGRFVRKPKE